MDINELNQAKIPLIKINKKLNRFKGKVLFQEKLDMANMLLENAVLPKIESEENKK